MRTNLLVVVLLVLGLLAAFAAREAAAQNSPGGSTAAAGKSSGGSDVADKGESSRSFFGIVFSGGLTGFLIMMFLFALSIAAVSLAIEHLMTIREGVLMPEGLGEQVRDQLIAGNVSGADQICQAHPSFLAFVLRAGLGEVEGGWTAVEKAMEDATAEQSARLFRKIEFLSVIGNIAPMVGLLGTVIGMVMAFREVADTQGAARASQLAEGIYTALVTTVAGLLIAIPALGAFAIFRNRVDQLVAEAAYRAQHAIAPLKRRFVRRPGAAGSPSPPPVEGGY